MEITIEEVVSFLGVLAGIITSISVIYALIIKINNKRLNNDRAALIAPLEEKLDQLMNQSNELKQESSELKKEVSLIIQLNSTMITELKDLGHLNGGTSNKLEKLQEYILDNQ